MVERRFRFTQVHEIIIIAVILIVIGVILNNNHDCIFALAVVLSIGGSYLIIT